METDNKTAPVSAVQDQNQISLDLMNRMKMHGMADAILDRIVHSAHTVELSGESMRKLKAKK